MNKKVLFLLLSLGFCFLFFLFSVVVKKHYLTSFDFDMAVRLQNHTPLRLDPFLSMFSFLASFEVMSVLLIITLLIRRKLGGIIVFVIFLIAHTVELFGKTFINHPPPPFMFLRHHDSSITFASSYVQAGSSYPSGHSFRTIFLAIILFYMIYLSKKMTMPFKIIGGCVILGIIILVCASRISLGEHWSTDVIGGGIFGIGMGFLGLLFI